MKHTLVLENLNCANCAAKIEQKIADTEGFENVSFSFATKFLRFESDSKNPAAQIQRICDSFEDGVTVTTRGKAENLQKSKRFNKDYIILLIAAVLAALGFVLHFAGLQESMAGNIAVLVLCLCSALLSGGKIFLKGVKSVFRLRIDETTLLTVAVIAAFCLGEFTEAAAVTLLFSLGEIIEDKAVDASRRDIEKLAQIRPDTATLLVDGKESEVDARSVKIGSHIVVKPYERVPLDGVIIEGKTALDNSALTGESLPVEAEKGSAVMSGAVNGGGLIVLETTKEFGDSTAARILKLVEESAARKGQSEKLITRFASVYTPVVILISIIIAVVPPLCGLGGFSEWIYRALVCLVASCPCAIVISVPLAYYSGIGAASKIGVLIKGGRYIEALAKAETVVFDKTGTLTTGRLSVDRVISTSDYSENEVLSFAAACEKYSAHPIAQAIVSRAKELKLDLPKLCGYGESAGNGVFAYYNGKRLECGSAKDFKAEQKDIEDASVFVTLDGRLVGAIAVSDSLRAESKQVISELEDLKISTMMLTGDRQSSADKIKNELNMSDCVAELLPEGKLKALRRIKKKSGRPVCFVGDGINDAPVLSESDCGIAMGLGSEAAIEASDMVLASGTLDRLPDAVRLSRRVMRTIKTNIIFALAVKAAVIVLAALGVAAMWMSVVADTGVSVLCVLYAARLLKN